MGRCRRSRCGGGVVVRRGGARAAPAIRTAAVASEPAIRVDAPTTSSHGALAQQMFDKINAERRSRGLAAYLPNAQIIAAAQGHSNDMAARSTMTHTGSDGSNGGQRITRAGFVWGAWGENVAAGFGDPNVLYDAWYDSSGHRGQLLGNYRYAGVGVAANGQGALYWTLDVAS